MNKHPNRPRPRSGRALHTLPIGITLLLLAAVGFAGQKALFINSYHDGYPPSDEVTAAFQEEMSAAGVEVEVFYMDTKRNHDSAFIHAQVGAILDRVHANAPDIIAAADDNAVRYVVAPYFKNTAMPVVFCGVNWECAQYGLPAPNVTGILEVLPLRATIRTIKEEVEGIAAFLVLSENSNSERSNQTLLDPLFREEGLDPDYALVDTFAEWKTAFKAAQETHDLIYLPTNGAIRNWDPEEARQFVQRHIRVPVMTCDEFMMPYAVFGRTKVAAEQGEWAAQTCLALLSGKPLSQFPVTKNKESRVWTNAVLAEKLDLDHLSPPEAGAMSLND